jgi:hypothetical protein
LPSPDPVRIKFSDAPPKLVRMTNSPWSWPVNLRTTVPSSRSISRISCGRAGGHVSTWLHCVFVFRVRSTVSRGRTFGAWLTIA